MRTASERKLTVDDVGAVAPHQSIPLGKRPIGAHSVKAKLKKVADTECKDFNYILMHYFIERLLYRLSVSPYVGNFVLKGGLLLYTVLEQRARATRDIDLLAYHLQNLPDEMVRIFREIAVIPCDDAVSFDAEAITVERIKEDADYQGIRIKLTGFLDRSRHILQFDIGFGDVIVPKPVDMTYPSLLDMEPPHLKAYTLESVIAEKFQAGVYLAEANSRMKDFYDIYELCSAFDFEGSILYEAIAQTFERRNTEMPEVPTIFKETFPLLSDKQTQWKAFQRRLGVTLDKNFPAVMAAIRGFLLPVYIALCRKEPFSGHWDRVAQAWKG
jgi:predicted nucleotidyltransferase component of viral defense system